MAHPLGRLVFVGVNRCSGNDRGQPQSAPRQWGAETHKRTQRRKWCKTTQPNRQRSTGNNYCCSCCCRPRLANVGSNVYRRNTTVPATITFQTAPTPKTRWGNDSPVPPAGHQDRNQGRVQSTSILDGERGTRSEGSFCKAY